MEDFCAFGAKVVFLVLQRVDGGGDSAAADDEFLAGDGIYAHNGCIAEQTAEFDLFADALAGCGNYADGGGLVVDHADGDLVGDDAADGLGTRVAGDADHVQTDRANGGHCFELFERQYAALCRCDHARVLADGDERARQTADVAGCHDAALFDRVVEHGERCRGAGAAADLESHGFEDACHAVADGGRGCERKVYDAVGHVETFGSFICDELTDTGDLKCGLLDDVGKRGDSCDWRCQAACPS